LLLAVVLVGSAASLSACGHGPSDATTVLRGAEGVTVVSADGAAHPGVDGERLVVGETVRTTTADSALVTGRRLTTLGPSTALEIAGRSHYLLDAGTLVLDHRHGPDARIDAGPVTVEHVGATAVRVERGFAVRVAVFDGGAAAVTASERSMTVAALHEVDVPGASLPAASAPLALRDDALDTAAAPALVTADRALDRRAAALDRADGSAVPTALIRTLPSAPPATAVSERVLPVAIARADHSATLTDAYARANALRRDGGSWGVVAALSDATLAAVQDQLDDLLAGPPSTLALPAGEIGTRGASGVAALLAAAAPNAPGAGPAPGTSPQPVASTPAHGTGSAPAPTPTTTPLVQTLVNTITGLLPTGRSSAPPPSASVTPRPVPAPSTSGGLLGGVLGSLLGLG
jgi:hypothetical protein